MRVRNSHPPVECTIDGCHRPHEARGFCHKHYSAYRRHGRSEMLADHHSYASKGLIRRRDMREYRCWCEMKRRCLDPNRPAYKNYGGRGIKICDRWLNDFNAFFEDMGECPNGYSIERIDVNGDYCPENCKWASYAEQAANKRNNVKVNGVLLKDILAVEGVNVSTFYSWAKLADMPPADYYEALYG